MIRPQRNAWRDAIDLSAIWRIRFDPDDVGRAEGWGAGSDSGHAIAVPGSWNEQLAEAGWMNYVGAAWLQTEVFVPPHAAGRRVSLRFGSADYFAEVWVDGVRAGASGAAMLPFALDITALAQPGATVRVVVRVTNELPEQGPTQRVTRADYAAQDRRRDEYLPAVRFDFFPYGGINRPVHLVLAPMAAIVSVRVTTTMGGRVTVVVSAGGARARARVGGAVAEAALVDGHVALTLDIAAPRPWCPADPHLYALDVDLLDEAGAVIDRVTQAIGLREVTVRGTQLLLNGEPVTLRGFGKHEESPLHGRGLNLPQLVKDFGLLRWIGANSVRASHYPYAEEFLDRADAAGVLVIGEVFSINLDFRTVDATTLAAHKAAIGELIARDANRACVIAWSLANEPGYLGEAEYAGSGPYWAEIFAHARAADPARPLTHANVGYAGLSDPAFDHADIVTINRYHGWYSDPGQIEAAAAALKADLDALAHHGKPLFVAEFGADALAGQHATHDQLFTEEYQADLIAACWRVIADHPATIGGHVWNFADFRTAQHARRVVLNLKGVFTRARDPKMAAWRLRQLWGG